MIKTKQMECCIACGEVAAAREKKCDRLLPCGQLECCYTGGDRLAIYVGLIILICFFVTYFLILGTNRLTGHASRYIRSAVAALISGLYAGVCICFHFGFLQTPICALIVLGCVCVTAFGIGRVALKRCVVYTFLLCATIGVTELFNIDHLSCAFFCAVLIWIVGILGGNRVIQDQYSKTVCVNHKGVRYCFLGYLDTGNCLLDPISGESVLVMSGKAACMLTGLTVKELEAPLETMLRERKTGFRLIPYSTVGKENGMLLASRFSDIVIDGICQSRVIAFAPVELNGYDVLLGGKCV